MKNASQENIDLTAIHVCVAQDSTIYIQDILDECFVSVSVLSKHKLKKFL